MDKAIYLFDKVRYTENDIANLSWKDCEEWMADEDYFGDDTIMKIDANGYDTLEEALAQECCTEMIEGNRIKAFGF